MRVIWHHPKLHTAGPFKTINKPASLSLQHGLTVAGDAKPFTSWARRREFCAHTLAGCVAHASAPPAKFICTEDEGRVRAWFLCLCFAVLHAYSRANTMTCHFCFAHPAPFLMSPLTSSLMLSDGGRLQQVCSCTQSPSPLA
ncbi:hypothetical protein BU25DRAFT_31607 [Macroventuria anomochaeta]|uniref:Uncharacterized protein n=1 Tax=Macroventuria anomochaeta TaxID=301207 RepID=A0ACB6S5G0_9PLEO|nr:uncharacterized protein BU25DRAFT_31607 [Macroventuria anomochaeta]KAF2628752.1 hypothetical protein BU25DRAFT_31607 [Macroventuria anomochaeta]